MHLKGHISKSAQQNQRYDDSTNPKTGLKIKENKIRSTIWNAIIHKFVKKKSIGVVVALYGGANSESHCPIEFTLFFLVYASYLSSSFQIYLAHIPIHVQGVHFLFCFFLQMLWFFWALSVLPACCVYTHWKQGKTEKD